MMENDKKERGRSFEVQLYRTLVSTWVRGEKWGELISASILPLLYEGSRYISRRPHMNTSLYIKA